MNLVIPKAGAKGKLLFYKPASDAGLLNKSLCLAPALVVMKIITIIVINLVGHTLLCYLSAT